MSSQTLFVSSIEISGLFGRFHHRVALGGDGNLAIITAPNGYGKTVILRFLDSFFNRKFSYFWKLNFNEAAIVFSSGERVRIYREMEDSFSQSARKPGSIRISAEGFEAGGDMYELKRRVPPSSYRFLERSLPVERVGAEQWMEYPEKKVISTEQLLAKYHDVLPDEIGESHKLPSWLLKITGLIQVRLIETQRLLSIDLLDDGYRPPRERQNKAASVVEQDARDLSEKISRVLQQYANESQKLDQTFPKRVIDGRSAKVSSESEIRLKLQAVTEQRDSLVEAGIIDEAIYGPIQPDDALDDESVRKILEIYADDTAKKLSIFSSLFDRIRLFKEIMDGYFSFKEVKVGIENGISVQDVADRSPIPLAELSSGEQHELVLIYDLLFKVEGGALILIDEPELSLHVAWQKRFISDIQKIQKLNKLSIVIATHSPQIINDKWNLVQELSV